jgi:hypothetical protein
MIFISSPLWVKGSTFCAGIVGVLEVSEAVAFARFPCQNRSNEYRDDECDGGTFKAAMLLGNDRFTVVVEITEPLPAADLERAIEGLAGNELRLRVKRCSEVVFLEEVAPLPPDEKIASRLEQPLYNPNWLPGVRFLAIEQV